MLKNFRIWLKTTLALGAGSLWPPVEAMSYSRGVLMYNFNEDRFGEDLQNKPKVEDAPKMSVSHTVHNWKTPSAGKAENPSPGLDRHVLFGHTGDMRDPHTNLQKVDFMTTNQYFQQESIH
ncbi:unnamed protein product [Symbiodinium necroappetens]|uniref:Uncharacterized protein n=1 Tax=Symbiodinium necroappetens TaxID=1628268 RepID=A0A812SP57_9DINO|nr:unnamed protein product [Symbiodinium necroappetens]